MPERVAVLLGAGASADAELPLTTQLAEMIVGRVNAEHRDERGSLPDWVRALNFVYGSEGTARRHPTDGVHHRERDTILGMPIDILFDFVSVHVNEPKSADADIPINLDFSYVVERTRTSSSRHSNGQGCWLKAGVARARGRDRRSAIGPSD